LGKENPRSIRGEEEISYSSSFNRRGKRGGCKPPGGGNPIFFVEKGKKSVSEKGETTPTVISWKKKMLASNV